MVFKNCRDAGLFGLELSEMRSRYGENWESLGLPPDLGIRVALHFGPVLSRIDPVTRDSSYFGQHVSRAARLEPVTDLNSVFVTFEFAAWASTENITEFTCDYLGKPEFAKGYGNSSVYALRRLD
jgi:class 3 adenylate cyclase